MWSSESPPQRQTLEQISAALPDLDLTESGLVASESFLKRESVQSYLNFYRINFSVEIPHLNHYFGYYQAAGFRVACHVWRPTQSESRDSARGTVWLQHGYTDHVGVCQHAIRWLLQQGYSVVCFDLPGHGLSSGQQASIESFDQYRDVLAESVRKLQGMLPEPWHAMGQSTGCAVILSLLASAPEASNFKRVVLMAPLIRAKGWGNLRWSFYLLRLFKQRLKRTFTTNSHDQTFLDFLALRDPLQTRYMPLTWLTAMDRWVRDFDRIEVQERELVIIQGSADQTVDYRYNLNAIESKYPHSQIHMIDAAGHPLINESEYYREQCWAIASKALKGE
jgi:lysophospholipase